MDMISRTIDPVQLTAFIFDYPPDVLVQFLAVVPGNGGSSFPGAEYMVIKRLSITSHNKESFKIAEFL